MLGRVKLVNALLTCDPGNFNQITVVKDTCTTIVPPSPPLLEDQNVMLAVVK